MSTRISSAAVLLLLWGCGHKTDQAPVGNSADATVAGEAIECARGAAAFARDCTLERQSDSDGLILTVHHPDGAFHRLLVTKDGRGVIAADGAERARVTVIGADRIEVALGGDSYRLPATLRARAAPSR